MTVQRTRKRIDPAEAAARASEIIPDPSGQTEAPPRESTQVDAGAHVQDMPAQYPASARGPWGSIIDAVLAVDPAAMFARLQRELSLGGDDAMTYQVVHLALDRADRNYLDACLLMRAAKLEEQRIEREIEERLEVLRTTARAEVEAEKRKAIEEAKSKAVGRATIEEVKDRCFANWPDEMNRHERKRNEYHAARSVAEELASAWRSRAASLRELVQGLRGGR